MNRRREDNRGMEENTLAILDTSGFNRKETQITQETQDLNDDRMHIYSVSMIRFLYISVFRFMIFCCNFLGLAFLEAVRSASIVPVNGTAPTKYFTLPFFSLVGCCGCIVLRQFHKKSPI